MTLRFTVRVEARFESAHYLREYRGISEPLHGHSYKVEADAQLVMTTVGTALPSFGIGLLAAGAED